MKLYELLDAIKKLDCIIVGNGIGRVMVGISELSKD